MVEELVFLRDLAVVIGIAAATSLVFQRLKFPLVFGLLAAGFIIGPHTPPFELVQSEETLRTLAELGVVLLLFGLGLDFELRALRRVGGAALIITSVEILVMFWLGYETAIFLGWSQVDAIFTGAMLGISSTAIIVTTLRELGRLNEESSRILFAVLVLEDVAAVIILVLLSGYAASGGLVVGEALTVLGRMLLFLVALLLLGLLIVPRFVDAVAARYRPEVLVLTVLGLGIGAAVLSGGFGFHVGLGAFLMGTVMGEAKRRADVTRLLSPIHDLFTAVFFVSIGTLVDFGVLAQYWRPVGLLCIILVVGKLVGGAVPTLLAGYSGQTAVSVGAALAQIGEFSFVIAALGLSVGIMSPFLFSLIIGAAAITSLTSPLTIRYGPTIGQAIGRLMPRSVRTYGHVYVAWMSNARQRTGTKAHPVLVRARRGAVLAGILAILVLAAGFLLRTQATDLLVDLGTPSSMAPLVHWGLLAAVLLPLAYELVRDVHRWVEAARPVQPGRRRLGASFVVQTTIILAAIVLVGLPVVVAASPFLDTGPIIVGWLVLVAAGALVLWTQIRRLHRRLQVVVSEVLTEETVEAHVPAVLESLYQGPFPLDIHTRTETLQSADWVVGKTIAQVGLREATGSRAVLIERHDGAQEVPGPDTILMAGDHVTLMGAPGELDAAQSVLKRQRPEGEIHRELRPGRILVPEGSELDGKTLSEASLRIRYGLQVVAIVGPHGTNQNPDADAKIHAEDVLVVIGQERDIVRLSQDLHPEEAALLESTFLGHDLDEGKT